MLDSFSSLLGREGMQQVRVRRVLYIQNIYCASHHFLFSTTAVDRDSPR